MIQPRPHLLNLYRDVERGGGGQYVKLDRNERVTPLPEALRKEILAGLPANVFNTYPDISPLYAKLSAKLGVPENELYITSGSDAAIRRIFETFVGPGDGVLQPDPSFAMYQVYTKLYQGRAINVPYTASRELPVDSLIAALASERPRVVFVANPDQPTGTALAASELQRIAAAARANDVLMIVDEAYHPFHPNSALAWREQFDNVMVTRTFSKVGGLAGLRVGYIVGPAPLIEWTQRTRSSFEVNGVAIAVASWLLDHPEIDDEHVAEVKAGREVLRNAATELGLGFPECETNFQHLRFPPGTNLKAIFEGLKAEGLLIKGPFGAPSLTDCLRVSLSGPEMMERFVAALRRVLAQVQQEAGAAA